MWLRLLKSVASDQYLHRVVGPARVGHRVILNGVGTAFLTSETIFEHEDRDAAMPRPGMGPRQRPPLLPPRPRPGSAI